MKKNSEKYPNIFWHGSGGLIHRQARWRSLKKRATTITLLFFFFLFVGAVVFLGWIDVFSRSIKVELLRWIPSMIAAHACRLICIFSTCKIKKRRSSEPPEKGHPSQPLLTFNKTPKGLKFPLIDAKGKKTQTSPNSTCPNYLRWIHEDLQPWKETGITREEDKGKKIQTSPNSTCPDYFRWIHEDLRPWKKIGITRDMVKRARRTAHFRLVIVNGRAYLEKYRKSIQTRDMSTLWGILQLLRWYPGRLPDLELMFDCDDRPVVPPKEFWSWKPSPPPLFRYCADERSLDIVFPDWSFWGWAETNIKPWRSTLKDIRKGNKRTKWKDRVPYAYWRGNPHVSPIRGDLMKCNVSDKDNWNTLLYIQDWDQESKQGYKQSKLENQCTHRYKIYTEGWAWSVSEKYILACDSMTLLIRPHYYDFFIRGMVPLQHYWPIRDSTKCTSLKFAVEWGNKHQEQAQAIGEASSKFIQEDLKMDYVYDYMFHLLNEYAKLLKFKPTIPHGAVELCSETMAWPTDGVWKKFMVESMEMSPSDTTPCTLPPPYGAPALQAFLERKANSTRQVEMWENEYWKSSKNKKQ